MAISVEFGRRGDRMEAEAREIGLQELEGKASHLERYLREADSRLKIIVNDNLVTRLIQTLSNENPPQTEPVDIRTCDQSVPGWSSPVNDQSTNVHSFHHPYSKSADMALPVDQARIDGKEFFRQARHVAYLALTYEANISFFCSSSSSRSRLSYEQFRAFLANIKELNAQKQTRDASKKAVIFFCNPCLQVHTH